MPERIFEDPHLPPPGRRTGVGSASIVPYLRKSLAAKPQVPALAEQRSLPLPVPGAGSIGPAESRLP